MNRSRATPHEGRKLNRRGGISESWQLTALSAGSAVGCCGGDFRFYSRAISGRLDASKDMLMTFLEAKGDLC
jgi:hypothetical protein